MNCDQAFERLTDPAVGCDAELEAHLYGCPRCRDMSEILEPALRFVTRSGEDNWQEPGWSFPSQLPQAEPKPFLTQQAVWVAEEAAASLSVRRASKQRSGLGFVCLVGTAALLLVSAVFFIDRKEPSRPVASGNEFQQLDVGACTRAQFADSSSEEQLDPIFAHDVVMLCNSCHLMRRPRVPLGGDALRLKPADVPREKVLREETSATDDFTRVMVLRRIAAVVSVHRAC